jgi:hypothetical protein
LKEKTMNLTLRISITLCIILVSLLFPNVPFVHADGPLDASLTPNYTNFQRYSGYVIVPMEDSLTLGNQRTSSVSTAANWKTPCTGYTTAAPDVFFGRRSHEYMQVFYGSGSEEVDSADVRLIIFDLDSQLWYCEGVEGVAFDDVLDHRFAVWIAYPTPRIKARGVLFIVASPYYNYQQRPKLDPAEAALAVTGGGGGGGIKVLEATSEILTNRRGIQFTFTLEADAMADGDLYLNVWPVDASTHRYLTNTTGNSQYTDPGGLLTTWAKFRPRFDEPFVVSVFLPDNQFPCGNYDHYYVMNVQFEYNGAWYSALDGVYIGNIDTPYHLSCSN